MPLRILLCFVMLASVGSSFSLAQHKPKAIADTSQTGSIIGSQYTALPGERTVLTMTQTDSSRSLVLLDSVFSAPQQIICTQSMTQAQIHRRYPRAVIIVYPEDIVGSTWTVQFNSGKTAMQEKVLLLH